MVQTVVLAMVRSKIASSYKTNETKQNNQQQQQQTNERAPHLFGIQHTRTSCQIIDSDFLLFYNRLLHLILAEDRY